MLLTVRLGDGNRELSTALLGGEEERHEEFWFGQGLAWVESGDGTAAVHFSLLVDVPRVVERTKRRDLEERFSVGFTDSYPYEAAGLMALFLSRFPLSVREHRRRIELEIIYYPDRPYGLEIAQRLFAPSGYTVAVEGGRLRLQGEMIIESALVELPVLLLALDRRTRLFLTQAELSEIGRGKTLWVSFHPARRAIELALAGRPTALRHLIPGGAPLLGRASSGNDEDDTVPERGISISTSLISAVRLAPTQLSFAGKALSKVNIDPRWLIYLPSAIASLQSTREDVGLERPESAIEYYRHERIEKVVVEEKHMGSRGIVIVCKSHQAASKRFQVSGEIPGCVYTRNGRRFFKNGDTEAVFLERLGQVLTRANFWKRFDTDFFCFDGEILPWSLKAAESSEESDLVESGSPVLSETARALGADPESVLRKHWSNLIAEERSALERYDVMFKRYRTESANLSDLRFAPFHLLAVEGRTFFDRSHLWHMQFFSRLARSGGGFVLPTRYEILNTNDPRTWAKTLLWWDELSAKNSEGFVVKPLPFVPKGRRGFAQPALKCRSKEHLRLVYGPKYDAKEIAEVLIARNSLIHRRNKHRRILKQFALSMEAVSRFVKRSPMDAVLECVLGVLAQEVPPIVRA
jgi:hypothetical protein